METDNNQPDGPGSFLWLVIVVVAISLVVALCSCEGPEGPIGPQGEQGIPGVPGFVLIKTYTGSIPTNGTHVLDIPEISQKVLTTFILAYWAYEGSPSIWFPLADGRLDNSYARIFAVHWDYGEVRFHQMLAGDLYQIYIFEITK